MWWWIFCVITGSIASADAGLQAMVAIALFNGGLAAVLAFYTDSVAARLYSQLNDESNTSLQTVNWAEWAFIKTAKFRVVASPGRATINVTFFGLPFWAKWPCTFDSMSAAKSFANRQYSLLLTQSMARRSARKQVLNIKRPSFMDDL